VGFCETINLIPNLAIPSVFNRLVSHYTGILSRGGELEPSGYQNRSRKLKDFVGIDVALPFHSVCQGTTRMEYL
jgi:hypothetical protein